MARKKKKKNRTFSIIALVMCCLLLLIFGIHFIKSQREINAKEEKLAELESVYDSQTAANESLRNAVTEGDEAVLAEEYARQKGYVMPDERVYVDITPGAEE